MSGNGTTRVRAGGASLIASLLGLLLMFAVSGAAVQARSHRNTDDQASPAGTGGQGGEPRDRKPGEEQETRGPEARLLAVVIVGPSHDATESYLQRGEAFAAAAERTGMEVRRVFHPNATWDAVVQASQGANLLVYLGHGNGWPSPYAPYQGLTKNGFGLDPRPGAAETEVKYYGEGPISTRIKLAPSAIVLLSHLCYASGNAEPGMPIPTEEIAFQRADNFAAGFLASGARAVFAYGWQPVTDVLARLTAGRQTMGEIFEGRGHIGWRDSIRESVRVPGMAVRLDPYAEHGYLRSFVGDPAMTSANFRSGVSTDRPEWVPAAQTAAPGSSLDSYGPGVRRHAGPPTVHTAADSGTSGDAGAAVPTFSPDEDGEGDAVAVPYWMSEDSTLAITVADADGNTVRSILVEAGHGMGTAIWDGRNDLGGDVPDGRYWLLLAPIDEQETVGAAAEVVVDVLTGRRTRPAWTGLVPPRPRDLAETGEPLSAIPGSGDPTEGPHESRNTER